MLASCGASGKGNYPTPKQYDLNHPYKIDLPAELKEISGIVYYPKDTSVFSICDNDGWIHKFYLKTKRVQKWKFGKNHDYEDLAVVDSVVYAMSSSGDIARTRFYRPGDSLHTDLFSFPGGGKNEFESMYYDPAAGTLNMLCKDCAGDKKSSVSTWTFNIATGAYVQSPVQLDVKPIAKTLGEDKVRFKPSATAIDPLTNELYVISSVNKVLVIADRSGNVKEVYPLDPTIYKQPEGIAFTPTGDLLISNEVNTGEYATILIFKNKTQGK